MTKVNRDNDLLNFIKKTDSEGISRLQAFDKFAKKNKLKKETIRNLYYNLVKNKNLQKEHKIEHSIPFSSNELKTSMSSIIKELNMNKSLRYACFKVSNGDAKVMLRLQNKFRSLLKNDINYLINLGYKVDNKTSKISQFNKNNKMCQCNKNDSLLSKNDNNLANLDNYTTKNIINGYKEDKKNNTAGDAKILRMPNTNVLTDNDINNLFMGLVKMVKRNAIEMAPLTLRNQCELANASLREALVKLGVSSRKLEVIKCENFELKQKLKESEKLLKDARIEVAEIINKINSVGKLEDLKKFMNEYKKKSMKLDKEKNLQ